MYFHINTNWYTIHKNKKWYVIIYEKNNRIELITKIIGGHQFMILLGDYELQRIFFKFFISACFLISMKKGKIIIL